MGEKNKKYSLSIKIKKINSIKHENQQYHTDSQQNYTNLQRLSHYIQEELYS